ncbi:MAG: hypothetical protein AAF742_07485, partial [Pseudomonadota bacterium]
MIRLAVWLAIALFSVVPSWALQSEAQDRLEPSKTRIAYLFSDGNIPGTIKAYETLLRERPDLRDQLDIVWLSESTYDQTSRDDMVNADVLVLDMMNEQIL